MNKKELWEKVTTAIIGAWLSNQFGLLFPMLCLLLVLMVADYVSGMIASKKEAIENPDNFTYGWRRKGNFRYF